MDINRELERENRQVEAQGAAERHEDENALQGYAQVTMRELAEKYNEQRDHKAHNFREQVSNLSSQDASRSRGRNSDLMLSIKSHLAKLTVDLDDNVPYDDMALFEEMYEKKCLETEALTDLCNKYLFSSRKRTTPTAMNA